MVGGLQNGMRSLLVMSRKLLHCPCAPRIFKTPPPTLASFLSSACLRAAWLAASCSAMRSFCTCAGSFWILRDGAVGM